MSLDTEIFIMPSGSDLVSKVADRLRRFPESQRADALRSMQRNLPEPEATELRYAWPLHARESQLPPDGDWDTWLILAGRGFGKTRTGAEWVRDQVESKAAHRIALVARALDEAQSVMIEGESGILNISPHWNMPTYEPSKRKLTWPRPRRRPGPRRHRPNPQPQPHQLLVNPQTLNPKPKSLIPLRIVSEAQRPFDKA